MEHQSKTPKEQRKPDAQTQLGEKTEQHETPQIDNKFLTSTNKTHDINKVKMVEALQRQIGNHATRNMVQRWGWVQRHEDHTHVDAAAGGATGSTSSAEPIKDALKLMEAGSLIEKNTAEVIKSGTIHAYYYDECPPDPKSDLPADSPYKDILHPTMKHVMRVQKNAIGSRNAKSGDIFVARTLSVESVRSTLVHEVNHGLRGDKDSDNDAASIARYKDEFQAYWVDGGFNSEPDLDKRAEAIKQHLLRDYPAIKGKYDSDEDFKKQVDNHKRPDGNVINSPRWLAIQEAVKGAGTDEDAVFSALKGMSPDELRFVRGDNNFMKLLKEDLNHDEMLMAYLYLYEFGEPAVKAVEATIGWGTDEDLIYSSLRKLDPSTRSRLKGYGEFMDRMRDDLNDDEMHIVNDILDGKEKTGS